MIGRSGHIWSLVSDNNVLGDASLELLPLLLPGDEGGGNETSPLLERLRDVDLFLPLHSEEVIDLDRGRPNLGGRPIRGSLLGGRFDCGNDIKDELEDVEVRFDLLPVLTPSNDLSTELELLTAADSLRTSLSSLGDCVLNTIGLLGAALLK